MVAATYLTQQQLWATFSGAISSRPSMRIRRPGHKTYDRPRRWTSQRPDDVAAVLLYDSDKHTRCLVFDFDIGRGKEGKARAAADAAIFAKAVKSAGGRTIVDRSPSGGHHVYIRLVTARPYEAVEPLMRGMRGRFATLDILPMVNAATGCIRPPGAAHPAGGYQQLVTPVPEALEALARPNSDDVWRELVKMAGTVPRTKRAARRATAASFAGAQRWRGRPKYRLPAMYEVIARTGRYDRGQHPTASHARMAVLFAAYHQGWLLDEVIEAARPGGLWEGLHRLFANQVIATQLPHEWGVADAEIRGGGASPVPISDARELLQTPPRVRPADRDAEYRWLRNWWTAMRLCERRRYDEDPLSTRLVLRALAGMAQRRGSRYLAIGVRSLALACNLDHSTVGRVLRRLRADADPLLDLMDGERGGDRPDIYQLCIPEEFADEVAIVPWRPGKLEAIHPAFLVLGVPAAFVYEALGEQRDPLGTSHVVDVTMLSRSATSDALRTLKAEGLAVRDPDGWSRGPTTLDSVAHELGADEIFKDRVKAYADDRKEFRQRISKAIDEPAPADEPPVDMWATELHEPDEDPPERVIVMPEESVISLDDAVILLERDLGAVELPP